MLWKTEDCPSIENPLDFENRFRKSIATQTTDIPEIEIGNDFENYSDTASADNTDTNAPMENDSPTEEGENVTNPIQPSLEDYVSLTEMCDDAADQRHHPPITEDNTARATDDSDKSPSTESTTDVSTEAVDVVTPLSMDGLHLGMPHTSARAKNLKETKIAIW
ncbi:hypothetical protein OUZ56_006073 [Daphnia magna]|uniref:Uncharacterized protein n=1 Tax=Daphnia magna TaxID=35525 RepID=A0ABQ9YUL0_9CRUS|nr:hypothetical protein OUZ56_006073 [Daphnia magna]